MRHRQLSPLPVLTSDEAHKATGYYAYTTVLAYITAQNPYFRVLALTATPGSDAPGVQAVVDALHISRIEIREAEAPEVRQYMNTKVSELLLQARISTYHSISRST